MSGSINFVGDYTEVSDDDVGGNRHGQRLFEYYGWVYHLGVNSIGHEYCHLRFLFIRGKYVAMYKRDPTKESGIKPIRKGIIGPTFMVEDVGCRKVNRGDVYVLRLYNQLEETKKGEIACVSAEESRQWIGAFEQAKQQAEYDLVRGSSRHLLNTGNELNLEGHRPRVRRYAHGLRKLIRIGKGPEVLLRQSSDLGSNDKIETYFEKDVGDAVDRHLWKCVHTVNGIRIFEDMIESKSGKSIVVKSVGVVDASLDTVFETIYSLDKHKRYEWDTLTGDLDRIEEVNGHIDVVYGTYDSRYLSRWYPKMDFVFSRHWFRSQDTYNILQFPSVHRKFPPKSGYKRTEINASTWEIRKLSTPQSSNVAKCLVTLMLELHPSFWDRWKKRYSSNFEKTISFALLCQVAGLREYFAANHAFVTVSPPSSVHSSISDVSNLTPVFEDSDMKDEFYDAIANDEPLEDEDSEEEFELPKGGSMKLKSVSWAIASFLRKSAVSAEKVELDTTFPPVDIDLSQFRGCLHQAKDETDTNCWACPSGGGFIVRGKTYLTDFCKITGGDPLLKLLAVDWFKTENRIDGIALHPKCVVQSEAAKKLPFILVINLQVPAKPNYNLVLYYGAERPVNKESLLRKFVNGTDAFRNARFKLIPSIVEGYWMVKRAVGTKACLLGKAVTCRYLHQDNFLEIDVDIGSSSVAKSIIGLVLGYVTGIVVDLAILIEAREELELPEYILGTVRLNRLKLETAVEI